MDGLQIKFFGLFYVFEVDQKIRQTDFERQQIIKPETIEITFRFLDFFYFSISQFSDV